MPVPIGELAAIATAVCWALTAVAFADAGARIGSLVVNFVRLVLALFMLAGLCWLTRGLAWPTDATPHAWAWLSVSGVVGLALGDLCLFRALVVIGPRLGSLLMSLAPPLTALIGWLVLGETLRGDQLVGMGLTVGGVSWTLAERRSPQALRAVDRRAMGIGVLLGLGGALGQAGGLVLSKLGMGDYDAFAATQIRVLAAMATFALIFTVTRWWPRVGRGLRDHRAMLITTAGAVVGPFLGVGLSLLAVQHTSTGVAASLMAISPVLIIPVVVITGQERVSRGGLLGTLVAVAGVIVLVR